MQGRQRLPPILHRCSQSISSIALRPTDWPLVCFSFDSSFFMDISLPFGLRWAASHCQDVMSLITRELTRRGSSVLNYIDNFGMVSHSHSMAVTHFGRLWGLLTRLGLQEATHKATPPATSMIWLGLLFDSEAMIVTLPLVYFRKY